MTFTVADLIKEMNHPLSLNAIRGSARSLTSACCGRSVSIGHMGVLFVGTARKHALTHADTFSNTQRNTE